MAATADWNLGANWLEGAAPGAGDDAFITNAITGDRTISNRAAATQIANFTMSNSVAFTHTLFLSNNTFRVDGTSVIGRNAIFQLGTLGVQASASTFSNGNLFLVGNAAIRFAGSGSASFPDRLIVAGTFTNTTASVMTNFGGGAVNMRFDADRPVTNAGLMAFLMFRGASGQELFRLSIGTTSNNFFVNTGTLVFGTFSNSADRTFTISNQFVNAGTFIITNAAVAGAGGQPGVGIIGTTRASGGASTNTATGTIRLVQFHTGNSSGSSQAGTLTFVNGDFVNLGTITLNSLSNNTTAIRLAEAGAIFSNAASGRIIMEASSFTFPLSIRADNHVNLGTIVLSNSGTLNIQNSVSPFPTTNLLNAGTILFGGGNLNARLISNSGTIFGFGTIASGTVFNEGGRIQSSGGLLFLQGVTNTGGSVVLEGGSMMRVRGLANSASGVVSNTGVATLQVAGDFLNFASGTTSNSFNLTLTDVQFFTTGTVSLATLRLAGKDFGSTHAGLTNNYAFGALTVTNLPGQTLTLSLAGAPGAALYLSNLTVAAGQELNLAGFKIYFSGTTNILGTLTLAGGAVIDLNAPPPGNTNIFLLAGPGTFDYDTAGNWSLGVVATNSAHVVVIDSGGGVIVTQNVVAAAFTVESMTVSNSSRLVIGRDQTWTSGGTIGNGGTIEFRPGNTVTATLTVLSNGVAVGAGTISGLINNTAFGTVIASNGVLTSVAGITNAGTVIVKSTLNVTPAWANGAAGTVTLQGGVLTGGTFTVKGTVGGNGTFAANVDIGSGQAVNSTGSGLAFRNTTTIAGNITGNGTVLNAGTFIGSGGTVNPTVTNAGVVRVSSGSTLTLNNTLLNSGTVVLNSTLIVSNLNNLAGGVLSNAAASSLIINGGNFFNKSTNSNAFNLASTAVTLQNGSGTLTFEVAGSDFGATFAGYTNNYALSSLTITNYTVKLQSAGFSITGSNAIYLTSLDLRSDATLDLNGLNIYFTGTTNILGTLVLNGGQIIEIAPPPATDIIFITAGGTQDYDTTANWSPAQPATNPVNKVLIAVGGNTVVTQSSALAAFTIDTMTVSNASTLVLGRNQTWTGGGTIDTGGTVRISSNITLTAAVTITNTGTLRGAGTITGLVTLRSAGTLDVTNGTLRLITQPTLEGTVLVQSGGTLNVGGNYVINNGTINLLGGAILGTEMTNFGLIASSGGLISNGFVNAAGAFFVVTSGTTVLTPDLENYGVVSNSATIIISNTLAGTLGTVTNAGLIRLGLPTGSTGGTLTSGSITNTGTIVGFGTITGPLLNTAAGLLDVTNGTLRLFSAPTQNGLVRVQTGSTLLLTNAAAGTLRDWANAGTLELRRGTVSSGNLTNTGTIIGGITGANSTLSANTINSGSFFVTNGTLNVTVGLSNAAAGTVDVSNDATLNNLAGAWANAGTVLLKGGVITGGQLDNAGTLTVSDPVAAGTVTISAVLRNSGTVDVTSGLFVLINPFLSTVTNLAGGTYRIATADAVRFTHTGAAGTSSNNFFNEGTFIFNSGTIAGGDFVNAGTFRAAHAGTGTITINSSTLSSSFDAPFSNTVSGRIIVDSGTVLSSRTIVNLGVIDTYGSGVLGGIAATGSNFTNAPGGLIINTNSAATLGIQAAGDRFLNLGTIVVSNNATINMQNTAAPATGTGWRNTNTVILGSATSFGVINSGTINNDGTIRGTGTINLGVGSPPNAPRPIVQSGTGHLIVTNGDLTITHLSINRLSIGGGTLTVSGGNTLRIFSDLAAATNAILLNSARVRLFGGTIISANITNNPTGTIRGFGTLSFNNGPLAGSVSNLHNQGTIMASDPSLPLVLDGAWVFNQTNGVLGADTGRLLVMGTFTNRGTVSFLSSVGTFNSVVINQGAWITDPTTNVFNSDLFVDTNAYIQAASGDVYIFKSNFVNISQRSNDFDTLGAKFIFDGTNTVSGSSYTQLFYVAGLNLQATGTTFMSPIETSPTNDFIFHQTDPIFGFTNNFALGALEIGNPGTNSILALVDAFGFTNIYGANIDDGKVAGLYVENLTLFGSSILIISNNVQLYYKNATNLFLDGPNQNVFLLGNASIHQLFVVPEPSVLMFLIMGGAAIAARRKRERSRRK